MKQAPIPHAGRSPRQGRVQHGVVLVFVLIALVIMLVGAVALVRSFNTSLFNAGNLAFKRDLTNQGERVMPIVRAALYKDGVLGTIERRAVDVRDANYHATILPTNAQGIPQVLLGSDQDFEQVGTAVRDLQFDDQQVKVRYVMDRLCDSPGLESELGADHCAVGGVVNESGSGSDIGHTGNSNTNADGLSLPVIYRLTIRVDGPRHTQAFFQTTLTP